MKVYKKIAIAILLILVFLLGMTTRSIQDRWFKDQSSMSQLDLVNRLIDRYYVDSVDFDSLQKQVIPLMLTKLDPHSAYLPKELNQKEQESLEGSFQGIGVLFNRLIDTIVVSRVIEGGAAERAGLKSGDRILKADTISLEGADVSNDFIMSKLKGPKDSVVKLTIRRLGKVSEVEVVRGPVPVSSLDANYVVSDSILYVRLNRWGAKTRQEFLNAYLTASKEHKVKGFIIDLRDNAGGYMNTALALGADFLPEGKQLLYIQGKAYEKEEFVSEQDGLFLSMPLVVLINEYSASASEIFAGMVQDHDRALVIGRRSFGKGLVQSPFILPDSSVIRLTVARYFIPSDRSIQRDYSHGYLDYAQDLSKRYKHGELFNADSIEQNDSLIYYTLGGRPVYGGGGITPDVFIPRDSTGYNSYYLRLIQSGTLTKFAFTYADRHRKYLERFTKVEDLYNYLRALRKGLLFEYAYYAQKEGIPIRTTLLHRSSNLILSQLRALIADNVSPNRGAYYEIINKRSKVVLSAIEALRDGSWKPEIPEQVEDEDNSESPDSLAQTEAM